MSMQITQSKNQAIIDLKPEDRLKVVKDLSKVFPDIEDQLCSRHSTLLGKLKCTFNKLYSGFQPSYYIIVKGNTHIIGTQQDELEVSMGLENGVIILVAKTYQNNNIFLNGNHIDQELIFNCKGKLQEGLNQYSQQIQKIFQSAVSGSCLSKNLYGGIIYVHANIPEGFYNYRKSFLTGLFLSMLSINDRLSDYTVSQLIQKISQTKLVDQAFLQKQLYDYHNRHFCLMVGPVRYSIPLDNRLKLLFCRLDLAHCDVSHSKKKIKQLQQDKQKIITLLKERYGIRFFYEAIDNLLKINLSPYEIMGIQGFQDKSQEQITKLIDAQRTQLKTIYEISNLEIQVQELIKIKWKIDSQLRRIYNQEVVQLVEQVKQKTKIQACTIVQDQYLMLAVEKCKYSELICILRQLLHKGELKSKSCFKLEQQLVQTRWGEENGIGEKIFVSVPSTGISVFDPSSSIWFD